MLHKMKLNKDPFNRMKNGSKTIEFRLFDEKRQLIKIGDQIEFSKLPDLQEKLLVDVTELYREDTFENLFRKLYTDEEEIKRKTKAMYQIYSHEKEQQYGILGTEEYLPPAISFAHRLTRQLTKVRKDGTLPYLRPDGKSQVTVEFGEECWKVRLYFL